MHAEPAYTIEETRQGPFSLLVSLGSNGTAAGDAYVDDGISDPPGPNTILTFLVAENKLNILSKGEFEISQSMQNVTVLGVSEQPENVQLDGNDVEWTWNDGTQELVVESANIDLNGDHVLQW